MLRKSVTIPCVSLGTTTYSTSHYYPLADMHDAFVLPAGVNRFCDDLETMLGHRPGIFWRVCWSVISPMFLIVSLLTSDVGYTYIYSTCDYGSPYTYINFVNHLAQRLCVKCMVLFIWKLIHFRVFICALPFYKVTPPADVEALGKQVLLWLD